MSGLDKEPRALCSRNPNFKSGTHIASGGLMIRGNMYALFSSDVGAMQSLITFLLVSTMVPARPWTLKLAPSIDSGSELSAWLTIGCFSGCWRNARFSVSSSSLDWRCFVVCTHGRRSVLAQPTYPFVFRGAF